MHACGFDSVPSDLCALLAVRKLQKKAPGKDIASVRHYSGPMKGGASGGTIASGINMYLNPPVEAKAASKPCSLLPAAATRTADSADGEGAVAFNPVLNKWASPFVMAGVNTRVVRKSAGLYELEGAPYSHTPACFQYTEMSLAESRFAAYKSTASMALFGALFVFPPTRWLLQRFALPAPGQGPDKKVRETGFFKSTAVATASDGKSNRRVVDRAPPAPPLSLRPAPLQGPSRWPRCTAAPAATRATRRPPSWRPSSPS